jgi:hypothetical protein
MVLSHTAPFRLASHDKVWLFPRVEPIAATMATDRMPAVLDDVNWTTGLGESLLDGGLKVCLKPLS